MSINVLNALSQRYNLDKFGFQLVSDDVGHRLAVFGNRLKSVLKVKEFENLKAFDIGNYNAIEDDYLFCFVSDDYEEDNIQFIYVLPFDDEGNDIEVKNITDVLTPSFAEVIQRILDNEEILELTLNEDGQNQVYFSLK